MTATLCGIIIIVFVCAVGSKNLLGVDRATKGNDTDTHN